MQTESALFQIFCLLPVSNSPSRACKTVGIVEDHQSTVTPISIFRKRNPREGVQRPLRPGGGVLRPAVGKPSELGGEETVAAPFPGDSVLPSASRAAIPATAAWKLRPKSSTARSRSSSTNPKTACMCRKPSCTLFSDLSMHNIASQLFCPFVGARHAVPVFEPLNA